MNLDYYLDLYYDKFDENYPLVINSPMTKEEIIADIQNCILTDTKKEPPEYQENCDY